TDGAGRGHVDEPVAAHVRRRRGAVAAQRTRRPGRTEDDQLRRERRRPGLRARARGGRGTVPQHRRQPLRGYGHQRVRRLRRAIGDAPLASGCLAGVTRALVLETTDAVEEDIPLDTLLTADEAFLTSTTRDIQPIRAIDGKVLPSAPGPVTTEAMAAFTTLSAQDLDP